MEKEKHPSWFKLKLERKQLVKQLPPDSAVNVLLACWDYLETEEIPPTLNPFEKIAVSAFLPDLEEAWAKYEQRVKNGAKGGAPKGNKNAKRQEQPYGSICPHTPPNGAEVEEDPLKGDSSTIPSRGNKAGEPPLCGGGPPTPLFYEPPIYYNEKLGRYVDRRDSEK